MSVGVVIETRGLERVRRSLAKLSALDTAKLLDTVGELVENQVRTRIVDEKRSPEGELWAELSAEYAAWKRKVKGGGVGLLQFDGGLVDSITHEVHGDELIVGTNLAYGATHQYGRGGIPARPYLGLSDENWDEVEEVIVDWLREELGVLA